MAQVQYSPVPDASPQPIATPQVHVNTPGDAFGTGIAKAVEHFGGNLEHVGNELFARALAIQHLNNEAEARDADSQYIVESGRLYADYESLQGKAAVDARPKFEKDIIDLRTQMRDGLTNQNSQKMFDAQTQSSMARTIFSSARHMAQENKKWQVSTIEGNIDARESEALNNPKDENAFRESVRNVKFDVERLADIGGKDKDNLVSHHVSRLWASRIYGLSKTNPIAAREMLDNAIANKDIRGQEAVKLDEVVRGKENVVISRNVSDAINAGWGGWMKQQDIDRTVGVEDGLVRVMKRVQQTRPEIPFTIGETKGEDGRSISIMPLNKGDEQKISTAMFEAAQSLKIPLSSELSKAQEGLFALPADYDPRKIPKAEDEPERSKVKRANDYVKATYGDREDLYDPVERRVISDHNQEQQFKRQETYAAEGVLADVIMNGNGPSGKLPTTVEELTMSPGAAAAWDKLDPKHQRTIARQLMQNAKGDIAYTPERKLEYERLLGMAKQRPAEFNEADVWGVDLPKKQKSELLQLQSKLRTKPEDDPKVGHAVKVLTENGFMKGEKINKDNKNRYDQFVGNLSTQLDIFVENNKRQPNDKEIKEIGMNLVKTATTPGAVYGTNETRMFELKPPQAWVNTNTEVFKQKFNRDPKPYELQQIYAAQRFQELYGPGAKQEAPKTPETVKPKSGLKTKADLHPEAYKKPLTETENQYGRSR